MIDSSWQLLSETHDGTLWGHEMRAKVLGRISGCTQESVMDTDGNSSDKEYRMDEKLENTIVEYIVSYLEQCKSNHCESDLVERTIEMFRGDDLYKQCCVIDETIYDYRQKLITFCKVNLGEN